MGQPITIKMIDAVFQLLRDECFGCTGHERDNRAEEPYDCPQWCQNVIVRKLRERIEDSK